LPDLTVIIVSYNTRDLLLQCLSAVLAGVGSLTVDVVVVDNASEDGSADAVAQRFPQVRLIRNPDNRGFAAACNQGLAEAQGRYLLLLNPDTLVASNALADMAAFLDNNPRVGAVGAQLIHEDGRLQNSIANFPTLATELLNKSLLRRLFPSRYPGKERAFSGPVEVESVIGACMMVSRDALKEVGPLDESYFFFLEETDWCFRMRQGGWKIFSLPHVRVVHLQGRSARRDIVSARIEYYRSRYRFFSLHRPLASRFVLRVGLFIRLSVEFLSSLILSVVTGFSLRKERERLRVRAGLLAWHLAACPDSRGLSRSK
jgi:GT2 family glycosyltransferase